MYNQPYLPSESVTDDKMQCCKCDLHPTNTISEPQIMPSPFKIEVIEDSYSKGSEIHGQCLIICSECPINSL